MRPEISDNYVGRIAYYFEPVGSFSLLLQQNEIKDIAVQRSFTSDEFGNDDPAFADYTFISTDNGKDLFRYRSAELRKSVTSSGAFELMGQSSHAVKIASLSRAPQLSNSRPQLADKHFHEDSQFRFGGKRGIEQLCGF